MWREPPRPGCASFTAMRYTSCAAGALGRPTSEYERVSSRPSSSTCTFRWLPTVHGLHAAFGRGSRTRAPSGSGRGARARWPGAIAGCCACMADESCSARWMRRRIRLAPGTQLQRLVALQRLAQVAGARCARARASAPRRARLRAARSPRSRCGAAAARSTRLSRAAGPVDCAITKPFGDANGSVFARVELARTSVAARHLGQQRMEAAVLFDIAGERVFAQLAAARAARRCAPGSRAPRPSSTEATPRSAASRAAKPFERAAHFDRVVDVGFGEVLHREAAAGQRFEQALFLQPHERHADRRARGAEPLDQRELGDAAAGLQLAADDQFAQPAAACVRSARRRRRPSICAGVTLLITRPGAAGITAGFAPARRLPRRRSSCRSACAPTSSRRRCSGCRSV